MTETPTRPILRYHGGKWMIAPWIIQHFPEHRVYVEPYGGAGSVLLQKPRSFAEVYNDLDQEIVNVFRVLRDRTAASELARLLRLTPWSRDEFYGAYLPTEDDVERARRTVARSFMAFGTTSRRKNRTGFRAKPHRENSTGVGDWVNYPAAIESFVDRLTGVCIENKPAIEVILQQDSDTTLFYVDPPYVPSTRSSIKCSSDHDRAYTHDLKEEDHLTLAATLHKVQGGVILSGYACTLYDQDLYSDWYRVEREAFADRGIRRTEVLWLNARAEKLLKNKNHTLFENAGLGIRE